MKIKYLGTAAAEGMPALFCVCDACKKARKRGGKNIRTRSQAIVNDKLLIDFPCDTYMHILQNGIDLTDIHHCIITHIHGDHYYPTDMVYVKPGFAELPEDYTGLHIYGSSDIAEEMERIKEKTGGLTDYRCIPAFEPFQIEDFTVTPLKARHGAVDPYIYIIDDGKSQLLYANDTDLFPEETWAYLAEKKPKLDLVSMDCTGGAYEDLSYIGHMCLGRNIKCRERLLEIGVCDENTKFVLNHFSHNGLNTVYDDFVKIAEEHGFMATYDGMETEFHATKR